MSLMSAGTIEIPDSPGTAFDHGAFEPESRRVFVAHMARDRLEVVDADMNRHAATLHGFPEAARPVACEGRVLGTNPGGASLAGVRAHTPETRMATVSGART